jgi:DNA-binding IclR family transcriptional regulator
MDGVEALLTALDDGQWHTIGDLASQLDWTRSNTIGLVEILSDHGFVQYRRSDGTVRLDPELQYLRKEA